jgi:hypothetical protein
LDADLRRSGLPDGKETKMAATGAGDAGSAKALLCLESVLTADEKLEAWAIQHRLFALRHRRLAVGATSGRLIAITRRLLGGFELSNVRWQDLKEVHLKVGIVSATLSVAALEQTDLATGAPGTRNLEFEGLRKAEAQALYRICQAHDQAWREKRRIRDLEELRARSGGIQLGALSAAGSAGITEAAPLDTASKLRNAKAMLDAGLISDSEYEALRARIISNF